MDLPEVASAQTQRYQVGGFLGRGGLGAVYRAWDGRLGRWVAVKRLVIDSTVGAEEIENRMRSEANALASLQHPNVVTVYDFDIDEQGPFVVMEFVDGQALDSCIENAPLDGASFVELAQQTLSGVAAAHRAGILHRDLKPGNIMLTAVSEGSFQIKVLDFGLAKFTLQPLEQTVDQANTLLGSIYFMAPEQFRREPLDVRTDLYALGCVFYYTLTGRYPFAGESVAETMASHLRHDVSDVSLHRPDLPPATAAWVMRLLSLAPADRPASAAEALAGLLAAEPQAGTLAKQTEPGVGAWGRQRLPFLWLGGLCLIALAAGLGGRVFLPRVAPHAGVKPSISLFASVPVAHVRGSIPGCFTVVRTGDQSGVVTVMYSVHGSAKNGIDYEKIATEKTIKAGDAAEKILIMPTATTDQTRSDRHVRLTLVPASTYTVATPNEVKVKILYDH